MGAGGGGAGWGAGAGGGEQEHEPSLVLEVVVKNEEGDGPHLDEWEGGEAGGGK